MRNYFVVRSVELVVWGYLGKKELIYFNYELRIMNYELKNVGSSQRAKLC